MVQVFQRGAAGVSPGRLRRWLAAPPAPVVLAACAAVLGLRRPDAWTNPQFWAEDSFYYSSALLTGGRAFLENRGGYLNTLMRAVAALAGRLDPAVAPAIFVAAGTLGTLLVCGLTLSPRCPLPKYGGLCALAIVLVPEAHEVLLNLVNVQWVLGAGLILILLSADPTTPGARAFDLAAAAVIGLTGPFCILLLPGFAVRAWQRRSRASLVLLAAVAACAAVQLLELRTYGASLYAKQGAQVHAELFLPVIGRRVFGSLFMGVLLSPDTDIVISTVVALAGLGGFAYLALGPGERRGIRAMLGLAFLLLLGGALYRGRDLLTLFFTPETRARYVYIPQLVVLWLMLTAAAQKGRPQRWCAALLAWGLLVNLPRLREPAFIDFHWREYADRIRSGDPVVIPVNPNGWLLELPARGK